MIIGEVFEVRALLQPRAVTSGALLLASTSARAEEAAAPPVELVWEAPAACPGSDLVEQEVARVVGRPWSELGSDWRELRASVHAESGGYRLRVNVVTRAGAAHERSVMAASCTEATEAAVAILSASLAPTEPEPASESASRSEAGGEGEDGARSAQADAETLSAPTAKQGEGLEWRPALGARLGLDIGTLEHVAPFAQLFGGLQLGRFLASGFVGATGSVSGEVDSGAAGAQMFLAMAGLEVCAFITRGNPAFTGCGGVELGSLQASGFGTTERRDGRTFWSASLARAALDWHITATSVASLGATLVVPFRELVVVAPPEVVHRTPDVAVRPAIGLGVQFP